MIGKIIGGFFAFAAIAAVLIFGFGSWGTIDAGNVGVVLKMGAVTGEIKPAGFYGKEPWVEHVEPMNTQIQKEEVDTESASADVQVVHATVSLNLSLIPSQAATVYQTIGVNYVDTIVRPAMQESVKAIIAKFTAVELISKREDVRSQIADLLAQKLEPQGVKTEAINIVNLNFSPAFNTAIEAKVTAEQNALAAKNKLDQIKYEAEQNVATAEGQAKAIAIQASAIQAQGGESYIKMKAIEKWDGKLPTFMGGGTTPFVNISDLNK